MPLEGGKQVIFIRHGEKCSEDKIHLSKDGFVRAYGLVDYFLHTSGEFRVPSSIYAMKQHEPTSSNRCMETVFPLAKALGIAVHNDFTKLDIWNLKDAIEADKSPCILVCWEHHTIPWILHAMHYPVKYWGFDPMERDGSECFNATWVVKSGHLQAYRQFDVIDHRIKYTYPRFIPIFTIRQECPSQRRWCCF